MLYKTMIENLNNFSEKSPKLLFVLIVILTAKVVVDLFAYIMKKFMFKTKWIFKDPKKSETITNVLSSLLKYAIYFIALGEILKIFNVNPATYIAGASMLGLAVGFGSQGLIQDVVTGFFILFDDQFTIGDMVEIAGRVGICERIDLRTVKIRDYRGELLIIPNRNISLIGNFTKSYLNAVVDVFLHEENSSEAEKLLEVLSEKYWIELRNLIFTKPAIEVYQDTSRKIKYVRIFFRIWPEQGKIIEEGFVNRVRSTLREKNIPVYNDEILVFYQH